MRIVLSTCRPEDADTIADALLEERLAASVNIVPGVRTKVRFKGELLTQSECLLLIRTRDELIYRVERRMLELNTFEIPEVASLEIKEWNAAYAHWLLDAVDQRHVPASAADSQPSSQSSVRPAVSAEE